MLTIKPDRFMSLGWVWGPILIGSMLLIQGCTLEYSISSLKSQSSDNSGSPGGGDPETPTPPPSLSISPNTNLKLLTGESLQFSALGGVGAITWSDSGTGLLSPTGLFTAPLGMRSTIDFVKATDSTGQNVQASLSVQAFEQNLELSSASSKGRKHQIKNITSITSDLYAAAVPEPTIYSFLEYLQNSYITVLKSSDQGDSWGELVSYQVAPGVSTTVTRLLSYNEDLYLVGTFKMANGTGSGLFLAKSTDKGVSFSTVLSFAKDGESIILRDATISANGLNLVAAGYTAIGHINYAKIFTCEIASASCSEITESSTPLTYNWYTSLDKDADGNIYAGGTIRSDASTGGIKILKSTDHGATWNSLLNLSGLRIRFTIWL